MTTRSDTTPDAPDEEAREVTSEEATAEEAAPEEATAEEASPEVMPEPETPAAPSPEATLEAAAADADEAPAPRRRRGKRQLAHAQAHIKASFNNTILTITDLKGEVLAWGSGSGRETAIRTLQNMGLEVASIKDVTPVPHNGCRPKKRKGR